jgi:hypothetical protein
MTNLEKPKRYQNIHADLKSPIEWRKKKGSK